MAVAGRLVRSKDATRFCKMNAALQSAIIFVLASISCCAPVDDPIRIDLPVYDHPQVVADSPANQQWLPENYPGGEPVNPKPAAGENFVSLKLQAASNLLGNSLGQKDPATSYDEGGIFSAPVSTRESALQETEGYASKALSFKENIQGYVAGIFQPKPIVDTISEEEKYGNTGDKFYTVGRALVGGASGISNFVNSALEIPGNIFKGISRAASEKLNNLGGKLIGL